jgi:hypothetical protein
MSYVIYVEGWGFVRCPWTPKHLPRTYEEIHARALARSFFRNRGRRRPLIPRREGDADNVSASLGDSRWV